MRWGWRRRLLLAIVGLFLAVVACSTDQTTMTYTLLPGGTIENLSSVRVTMGPILNAPSTRPSLGQIELRNVATSRRVEILSVSMNGEETRPMDKQPLPTAPQFHISSLPDNLVLGPGQLAVVPVTFLPRFPSGNADTDFEVRATIEVKTDHGIVTLPVRATSTRRNEYDLPDTILLDQPRGADEADESTWEREGAAVNCRSLKIRASSDPLNIVQIVAVEAPYVSLSNSVTENRKLLSSWAEGEQVVSTEDPQLANRSLVVPADGEHHTIANVCVHMEEVLDKENGGDVDSWMHHGHYQSLGVLQVSTDRDVMFVQLEKIVHNLDAVHQDFQKPLDHDAELRAIPDELTFSFLKNETDLVERTIRVYVPQGSASMRLMRASTTLDKNKLDRQFGLHAKVQPHTSVDGEPMNLHAETDGLVLQDTVTLQVSLDWDVLLQKFGDSRHSVTFHGHVELRGTTGNDDFNTWSQKVRENPLVDVNLTMTVPITTTIVRSRLGFKLTSSSSRPAEGHLLEKTWDGDQNSAWVLLFPESVAAPRGRIRHDFHVFTNVLGKIQMSQIDVVAPERGLGNSKESDCTRFDIDIVRQQGNFGDFNIENTTELGVLRLLYSPDVGDPPGETHLSERSPTACRLKIKTEPDTGEHFLSMIIYSGWLDVSATKYGYGEDEESSDRGRTTWHDVMVGYDRLLGWFQGRAAGKALRNILGQTGQADGSREPLLRKYLYRLARDSMNLDGSRLRPILLNVGAVQHDSVVTVPFFLTNSNPVPVTISLDVSEVEGMTIALGREECMGPGDGNSIADYLPDEYRSSSGEPVLDTGSYESHPINGIRQFLLTDRVYVSFISQFPFRDAVSLSEMAVMKLPIIRELYKSKASSRFHESKTPRVFREGVFSPGCNSSDHPSNYGDFESNSDVIPGPILLSSDGRVYRQLAVCSGDESGLPYLPENVTLPPGGVARFDVQLRSPPKHVIESDISQFLATGLVLSTDQGQVLPVLLSFEAVQGTLEMSFPSSSVENTPDEDSVLRLSPRLFEPHGSREKERVSFRIPPVNTTVAVDIASATRPYDVSDESAPLFSRSTFSHDVHLVDVSSCNPWFRVESRSQNRENGNEDTGVYIGEITSAVSCYPPEGPMPKFPSFFRCAVHWMDNREHLQYEGCGDSVTIEVNSSDASTDFFGLNFGNYELGLRKAYEAIRDAMDALEDFDPKIGAAVQHKHYMPTKSGRRRGNGYAPSSLVDTVSQAWRAWLALSRLGFTEISTTLRAKVEYNLSDQLEFGANETSGGQLAITIKNLPITTMLDIPVLFDAPKAKSSGQNATSSSFDVPSILEFEPTRIGETSSLFIHIRNPTPVPVRVRLSIIGEPTSGDSENSEYRSFFVGGASSPYVQSAVVPSVLQNRGQSWWEGEASYFLENLFGEVTQSQQKTSVSAPGTGANFVLVNPAASAKTVFSTGCGRPCGIRDQVDSKLESRSPIIGASSSQDGSLAKRFRSHTFRDAAEKPDHENENGDIPAFGIPLAALDEIEVKPYGNARLGPVFFRPTGVPAECQGGSEDSNSYDVQLYESLVVLENSLSGLERVTLRGKALSRRISFKESGSSELDSFGDIEMRFGFPALLFNGDSSTGFAVRKGFLVENEGDLAISMVGLTILQARHTTQYDAKENCFAGDFHLLGCAERQWPFLLRPGESLEVVVEFSPSCRASPTFYEVRVVLDEGSGDSTWETILVGYDRPNPSCIPVRSVAKTEHSNGSLISKIIIELILDVVTLFALVLVLFWLGQVADSRWKTSLRFRAFLKPPLRTSQPVIFSWRSTFRCLARNDPVSSDLQALGREQSRHVVLARYRFSGALPSACVTQAGLFQRGGPGLDRGRPVGSSERSKILSDSIFKVFSPSIYQNAILPSGIKWQAVVSRGVSTSLLHAKLREVSASRLIVSHRSLVEAPLGDPSETSSTGETNGGSLYVEDDDSESTEGASVLSAPRSDDPSLISTSSKISEGDMKSSPLPGDSDVIKNSGRPSLHETADSSESTWLPVEKSTSSGSRNSPGSVSPTVNQPRKPEKSVHQQSQVDGASTVKKKIKVTGNTTVIEEKSAKKSKTQKKPGKGRNSNEKTSPQKKKSKEEKVRAPPGLTPPPGFSKPMSKSDDHTVSPLPIKGGNGIHEIEKSLDRQLPQESIENFLSSEDQRSHQPSASTTELLVPGSVASFDGDASTGEFDIMDFLDGILNDGATTVDQPDDHGAPQATSMPVASSNPWATGPGRSRAAAYGIAFEESSENVEDALELPLLTPAAILADDEDERNPGASFYSNLLGE